MSKVVTLRPVEPCGYLPSRTFLNGVLGGRILRNGSTIDVPYLCRDVCFEIGAEQPAVTVDKQTRLDVAVYWDNFDGLLVPQRKCWQMEPLPVDAICPDVCREFVAQGAFIGEFFLRVNELINGAPVQNQAFVPSRVVNVVGPSGSGKSYLIDCVKRRLLLEKIDVVRIDAVDLTDYKQRLNRSARRCYPAILFVENMDSLLEEHPHADFDSSESKFYFQFLFHLKRLLASYPLFCVFTSESPIRMEFLDPFVVDQTLWLSWSTLEQSKQLLGHFGLRPSPEFDQVARATKGFFPCEINNVLVGLACGQPVAACIKSCLPARLAANRRLRAVEPADTVGLDLQRETLLQTLRLFIAQPSACPLRGVVVHGDSGCGKSTLVAATLNELVPEGLFYMLLEASQIRSKYVGDSEKAIARAFAKAASFPRCVIVVDQMESLFSTRRQSSNRLVNCLLREMDDARTVFVVGITRFLGSIDEALVRPGRLFPHVHTPRLTRDGHAEFLRRKISLGVPIVLSDAEFGLLLDRMRPFTAADAAGLVQRAALHALQSSGMQATEIRIEHFLHVLQ